VGRSDKTPHVSRTFGCRVGTSGFSFPGIAALHELRRTETEAFEIRQRGLIIRGEGRSAGFARLFMGRTNRHTLPAASHGFLSGYKLRFKAAAARLSGEANFNFILIVEASS
jgi:hypothetical protein